ncbi:hypothetical protein [uncultured Erythrobacter sp.]|uniref:hypothetical protein n=1 Tax=uncultured Erythrobacter sp. TaxID=263913 RepID=UPI002618FE04|nr:hypothetical protein [uncultured Erythrobacter sp.]
MADTARLMVRTCRNDLSSCGGFQYPRTGYVEAEDWELADVAEVGIWGYLDGKGNLKEGLGLYYPRLWQVLTVLESEIEQPGTLGWRVPRARVDFTGDMQEVLDYLRGLNAYGRQVARNLELGYCSRDAFAIRGWHTMHVQELTDAELQQRHPSMRAFAPWRARPKSKRFEKRYADVRGATGYLECEKWSWERNYDGGILGVKTPFSWSTEVLIDAWEEVDIGDGTLKFPRCWVLDWKGPRARA